MYVKLWLQTQAGDRAVLSQWGSCKGTALDPWLSTTRTGGNVEWPASATPMASSPAVVLRENQVCDCRATNVPLVKGRVFQLAIRGAHDGNGIE